MPTTVVFTSFMIHHGEAVSCASWQVLSVPFPVSCLFLHLQVSICNEAYQSLYLINPKSALRNGSFLNMTATLMTREQQPCLIRAIHGFSYVQCSILGNQLHMFHRITVFTSAVSSSLGGVFVLLYSCILLFLCFILYSQAFSFVVRIAYLVLIRAQAGQPYDLL